MAKTVAEIFIATLVNAGVKRVYGVAGDSLNGLTDTIRKSKQIDWLHMRHEEVAAFAAGAEAQLTGELAVCAGSCGPGNLHLINGLFDCHRSRVPVLAIAAQIPSHEIGSGYFQETHPENLFKDCSDYCELVSQPEQMPRVLGIAMRTALTRRGVAVIVIPGDVALRECSAPALSLGIKDSAPVIRPSENELRKAAEILNNARKVTILGGAGCEGAHAELIAAAERLKSPIVHALRGKQRHRRCLLLRRHALGVAVYDRRPLQGRGAEGARDDQRHGHLQPVLRPERRRGRRQQHRAMPAG